MNNSKEEENGIRIKEREDAWELGLVEQLLSGEDGAACERMMTMECLVA
jgi:hypothetical protein